MNVQGKKECECYEWIYFGMSTIIVFFFILKGVIQTCFACMVIIAINVGGL